MQRGHMAPTEEEQLSKALEESLKTQTANIADIYEPLTIEKRVREDNTPVGLKNIGNSKAILP
jgi:hypothetical protein